MRSGVIFYIFRVIFCAVILFPVCSLAGQANIPGFHGSPAIRPPAPTQLPQLKQPSVAIPGISGFEHNASRNQMIIRQNQPKAIIDWSSFDIGADAWTQFDQQGNSTWVALNRIWDSKPSLIYGKLTADGKIYLINQNGILFGPGSKVNVHSLVASALNIADDNFLRDVFRNRNRVLIFEQDEGFDRLAAVSNHGRIVSTGGGALFLIGPRVENFGILDSPAGQVGLVAGTKVTLAQPDVNDLTRSGYYVLVDDDFSTASKDPAIGYAVNRAGGELRADGGTAGMYGNNLDQWGIIRSTTAFKNKKGLVELRAANKITTGEESKISLPVDASTDPETGKLATISDTFDIQPEVKIKGLHTWSSTDSIIDLSPARKIEHRGSITAPAGMVVLYADDRVYLEAGSRIDVSGVTVELPAPFISDFRLNTVELRDAYGQKGGVLQGEKITTTVTDGTSIGDISQLILTQDRTALERSIGGARRTKVDEKTGVITYNNPQIGEIYLSAADGDIIVKNGSLLDFSGGSIHYDDGFADTTKLLSGSKIYDISSAPLSVRYDKILSRYRKTFEKFGVREEYTGLYYGGSSPLKKHVKSHIKGGDAGKLSLSAKTIVLDGTLNGGVTSGAFQNIWTMKGSFSGENSAGNYDMAMALSERRGLEAPRAGTLEIKPMDYNEITNYSTAISILSAIEPRTNLTADARLEETTVLSAELLNTAGLGTLNFTANLTFSTGKDAAIRLEPGGFFSATARRIDHQGKISVPGGSIRLIAGQNLTTEKDSVGHENPPENIVPLEEKIVLGKGSLLDASGEKVDRRTGWNGGIDSGGFVHNTGGNIAIKDQTDRGKGVFIQSGAVVDVSGGYTINPNGRVTGGNAGLLEIQGSNIALDGTLKGFALSDENGAILGGTINLHSINIRVAPKVTTIKDTFVLSGDRFRDTGFSQIGLYSFNDIFIEPKTTITPSLLRLNSPVSSMQKGMQWSASARDAGRDRAELIRLDDSIAFTAGPSSFTAIAGTAFAGSAPEFTGNLKQVDIDANAKIIVSRGAAVATAPSVAAVTRVANDVGINPAPVQTGIFLRAPSIEVQGTLESMGGNIRLDATRGSIKTTQDTRILAKGYNRPDHASTLKGFSVNYLPVAGGSVSLSSYSDLSLASKSVIDISGSDEAKVRMRSNDGSFFTFLDAGEPGSLSLSFGGSLTWAGTVKVKNPGEQTEGIRGGALSIARIDTGQTEAVLTVGAADILRYKKAGFDDLTLKSPAKIQFTGAIDPSAGNIGRKLTLDAQEINGTANSVALSAPWIVLTNRTQPVSTSGNATQGALTISGEWIDVIGTAQFTGFKDVTIKARNDMRLSEAIYNDNIKGGRLSSTDNLTLDAARIYPYSFYSYRQGRTAVSTGAYSDFTIHAGKKLTVRNSSDISATNPIYSAGGNLVVEAGEGIEVMKGGYLSAPMGTIALNAPGRRILLADGSVISTAGNANTAVAYGVIDDSNLWITDDKVSIQNAVLFNKDLLPSKGVTMNADTVIVMDRALIDVSGGGSVFSYKFLPGIEGSNNPLAKSGRFIVFKDDSFQMPGETVFLKGGGGLGEGFYTILPLDANNPQNARYAFMPGAYILEAQKGTLLPASSQPALSKFGYPLTIGYSAVADTKIIGTRPKVYAVRTAADVLKEGHFVLPKPIKSGDAGDILFRGDSAIVNGVLRAIALADYQGGKLDLKGRNISVQASSVPLASNFGFTSSMPDKMKGVFSVTAGTVSGQGFREINLGDPAMTEKITIGSKTVLQAPVITCSANKMITVEPEAQLHGSGRNGIGSISLHSPAGSAVVGEGALLHAAHAFDLNVGNPDIQGDLKVDNSTVTLKAAEISFVRSKEGHNGHGLAVTENLWSKFVSCEDIELVSGSDIRFMDDFAISAVGKLSIDAPRITGVKEGGAVVSVTAPSIFIANSGATAITTAGENAGDITFSGNNISVGDGDVLFGGFANVHFSSTNEMVLKGSGSLRTGDADLKITAARLGTVSAARKNQNSSGLQSTPVIASNFLVDAGAGAVDISSNGSTIGASPSAGGILEISGRKINLASVIQVDAGTIKLTTKGVADKGDDGIFLRSGSRILARGADNAPGGRVLLSTDYIDASGALKSGGIILEEGSLIDVSAGGQGDAGMISLASPVQGVTISGIMRGAAQANGNGGTFILDTKEIGDFTALNAKLTAQTDDQGKVISGGFTGILDLRARAGDIDIPEGQTMRARRIKLQSDDHAKGRINVHGTLDASSFSDDGRVELYAFNDLTIHQTGKIFTGGGSASSKGGTVMLSSARGWVDLKSEGTVDLTGNRNGSGGILYLRAERNENDVKIRLRSKINGASAVYAEAVKTYSYDIEEGLNFEMRNTVLPAKSAISSLKIDEGSSASFSYNGIFYTAQLEAGEYASGEKLAAALETALNNATYIDYDNNEEVVPLPESIFQVDFGVTVPGRLTVRNISQDESDISGFTVPAQFGFVDNSIIHGAPSEDIADATAYYAGNTALSRLKSEASSVASVLHLLPGIEVVNTDGDITVGATALLGSRFGEAGAREPGVLTLRAAGNLIVGSSMVDNPTLREDLRASSMRDTWAFNLSAGSDINAADPVSVIRGKGDFSIANRVLVYTESAPIQFSAGKDTVIGASAGAGHMINKDMAYNLASYDGSIRGHTVRDLIITGGAIQTATGAIDLTVGRDLQLNLSRDSLNFIGTIRTTGQTTATAANGKNTGAQDLQQYWTYRDGGNINIDVGRHLGAFQQNRWFTALDVNAWDTFTRQTIVLPPQEGQTRPTEIHYGLFSASYERSHQTATTPTAGLATMGGGNLAVRTGGDFLAQTGTFGAGNLSIYAGGDVRGRFLVRKGLAEIHAMGNIGSAAERQQVELFDSRVNMTASGEIQIGAVLNPTLASSKIQNFRDHFVHCTYTTNTGIRLKAGTDVTIRGKSPFYNNAGESVEETILPAAVDIEAGGDIALLKYFTLTSSAIGNLRLKAGGDIRGAEPLTGADQYHMIMMSDIAPEYWYGLFQIYGTAETGRTWIADRTVNDSLASNKHGYYKDAEKQANSKPLHAVLEDDSEQLRTLKNNPIEIRAGGDIKNLKLYLPKRAEINARGRIENIMYEGQNNNPHDVSKIQAGGDISMAYVRSDEAASIAGNQLEGMIQGGPGVFFIQAGGSIDLGTLRDGIQTIGNGRYAQLGTGRSTLVILSGYTFDDDKTHDQISAFFTKIRKAGGDYAQLLAEGKLDEGADLLKQTREQTIVPFLTKPSGDGDINMTSSQIGTSIGQSDIFIIAAGDMNLGKTALPVSGTVNKKTGITTGGGGAINIFARGDVNVNESRVMTFFGGDITVWSDDGSINAGRGSRTAVSVSPPKVLDDGTKIFSPPAIGSGIRAVTFGDNAPKPGDIHLFAPSGVIDAGEAEISGSRIVLAAQQILNVQNIIFTAGSVGVPQPSAGGAGLGNISGSGALTQASKLTSETSGLAASRAQEVSKAIEDIMTKWLDVKVIDFVLEEKEKEEEGKR